MRSLLVEKFYDNNPKKWFKSILCSIEELPEHPDFITSVFYKLGNDIIFEYTEINGCFWIKYSPIWSFFENEFGFNYYEIQIFTKDILEKYYKLNNLTTLSTSLTYAAIKDHYKLK